MDILGDAVFSIETGTQVQRQYLIRDWQQWGPPALSRECKVIFEQVASMVKATAPHSTSEVR